jgi:hypothetical protein
MASASWGTSSEEPHKSELSSDFHYLAIASRTGRIPSLTVVLDADMVGRAGALKCAAALRDAGCDVQALDIGPALPGLVGGDVDDLHRQVGAGLAEALARLPILEEEKPEPSVEARPLRELLDAIVAMLERYMIFRTPLHARVLALWCALTHVVDALDCVPYLHFKSPTPGCAKSRVLQLLEAFVARPFRCAGATSASVFHQLDAEHSTLLLDEVDLYFKGQLTDSAKEIVHMLNVGYERGTRIPRCVGDSNSTKLYEVFGPKALAGIGNIPGPLGDRCLTILLRKRK